MKYVLVHKHIPIKAKQNKCGSSSFSAWMFGARLRFSTSNLLWSVWKGQFHDIYELWIFFIIQLFLPRKDLEFCLIFVRWLHIRKRLPIPCICIMHLGDFLDTGSNLKNSSNHTVTFRRTIILKMGWTLLWIPKKLWFMFEKCWKLQDVRISHGLCGSECTGQSVTNIPIL